MIKIYSQYLVITYNGNNLKNNVHVELNHLAVHRKHWNSTTLQSNTYVKKKIDKIIE